MIISIKMSENGKMTAVSVAMAQTISDALSHHEINTLDMSNTQIGPEAADIIAKAISNSQLKKIDLTNCQMDPAGEIKILNAIKNNKGLTERIFDAGLLLRLIENRSAAQTQGTKFSKDMPSYSEMMGMGTGTEKIAPVTTTSEKTFKNK